MALELVASDSTFVAALLASVDAIRRSDVSTSEQAPTSATLSRAHLAELCNLAFWASLEQEERRPIRANLAIGSPREFSNPLLLRSPERLGVTSLVSLASASEGSVLGVHVGADNGLEIWGIAKRPPKLAINVSIIKPGTVGVFLYQGLFPSVAGLIDNGELVIPNDASLRTFQELVAHTFDGSAPDLGSRFRRAGQLIEIVHTMHAHGHGGTVVTVPDDSSWKDCATLRYPCGTLDGSDFLRTYAEASFSSAREVERAIVTDPKTNPSEQLRERARSERSLARQAFRRVGQLTAVDGAVIIGNNFIVHGFGARLTPPDDDFELIVLDALSGNNSVVPVTILGGTRHQSAARFVSSNKQSIAIIASQDGGLMLVGRTRNEPAIVAIKSLQHLLIHWRGPIER